MVLVIIGLITGFTLSTGRTQLDIANIQGTQQTLSNVKQALLLFRDKQGRFPCPAPAADASTAATYGVEQTGCDLACPANITCMNNAAIGMLPFKTLGIDETSSYDAWDTKLTYAVDIQQTAGSSTANGTLPIVDSAGNKVTASPTYGDALFVVASHGPNKSGAYLRNGSLYAACAAGALDGENCNDDDTFRTAPMTNGTVAAKVYDDFIIWHTQDKQAAAEPQSTPCISGPLSTKRQKFSTGEYDTCYIGSDNKIYCWGSGMYGALAQGGAYTPAKTPIAIGGGINDWISVSTGWRHACGTRSNGHMYCWGRNWYGQIGNGTTTGDPTTGGSVGVHQPTEVSGASCSWSVMSAGNQHTCGIQTDGRAYCWGYGPTGTATTEPHEIEGGYTDWIYIDVIRRGGCGIRGVGGAGTLYCWGAGTVGQLGNGASLDSTTPVLVKDTTGSSSYNDWTLVSSEGTSGGSATCGIRSNGTAYCWGNNSDGQLGYGTTGGVINLPKQVVNTGNTGTWSDWSWIKGSENISCGVRGTGLGYCWGNGSSGQNGNGSLSTFNTPQLVSGGFTDWVSIDPEFSVATCGYRTNGNIYCWGNTWTSGLLGSNQPDNTKYSTPQLVTLPKPLQ